METTASREAALVRSDDSFEPDWYRRRYPDVAATGLDPLRHYLEIGEPLGRWAGPSFCAGWYRQRYDDVARAGASPLLHYIRSGRAEGRQPRPLSAMALEPALHAPEDDAAHQRALAELEALRHDDNALEADYACWVLARWHAANQRWCRAAEILTARGPGHWQMPAHYGPRLLALEALLHSGQWQAAQAACLRLLRDAPDYADACLAMANLLAAQAPVGSQAERSMPWETLRLRWVNRALRPAGLQAIELADASRPLLLDNLRGEPPARSANGESQPLISVIVPVYNAEAVLACALRSLRDQTHDNLEILVIDDASTDGSAGLAASFAEQDARFRLIRQSGNQGTYAARNRGLRESRGAYFTVHDSDDWSHPQKIALQLSALQANAGWQACRSSWVRCTDRLEFGGWLMERGWVYPNTSSLLFRRSVFETIGFWDRVRVNADTEYLNRTRAAFGARAVGEVLPGVPLSFGRMTQDSLSRDSATHRRTEFGGVRRVYHEASLKWHAEASREALYLSEFPQQRPFPAPEGNLP
ncbi:glycosyltransferase family A protein [Kushneria aurantia]|uniref:Glycosyltransferase n=1 Tax=Kushneria aurantia TaxID=504092 RepID=A0ABV6FYW1_9GAMM|nr:glycosyltransferase family A protein [Kushneria aurantia]